jgi:hypothetical protein
VRVRVPPRLLIISSQTQHFAGFFALGLNQLAKSFGLSRPAQDQSPVQTPDL